jgi:signal transduction histidine kinase
LPAVHVEEVIADGKAYPLDADVKLPALTRNLEIRYTALSFVQPQKVRFRYELEGHDDGWQDAGTRRQAFYDDLHPGRYHFRVIACNNDGVWNETGAAFSFSVSPAWFQTYWFRIFCAAATLLVIWAAYRMRVRQVARHMSARFDDRLAERTRIARDLHDTLLQTIHASQLVADHALGPSSDPIRMRQQLEKLSTWLERAAGEGRAALNSLRTSSSEVNDLAEALRRAVEECRIQSSMETSFSVHGSARDMHPIVRDEIYRIGYEAIRNACAHSQGARLQVDLAYAKELTLCVLDDGVGISRDVTEEGRAGHFGLAGMRERAARIVGKLTITTSLGSGTEVKLVVPGEIVYRGAHGNPAH